MCRSTRRWRERERQGGKERGSSRAMGGGRGSGVETIPFGSRTIGDRDGRLKLHVVVVWVVSRSVGGGGWTVVGSRGPAFEEEQRRSGQEKRRALVASDAGRETERRWEQVLTSFLR